MGELLELCGRQTVRFVWVRGHAATPENLRCDDLTVTARQAANLPADEPYERAAQASPLLFSAEELQRARGVTVGGID